MFLFTEMLLVSTDPYEFRYVSQGDVTVAGMDDAQEYLATDVLTCINKYQSFSLYLLFSLNPDRFRCARFYSRRKKWNL